LQRKKLKPESSGCVDFEHDGRLEWVFDSFATHCAQKSGKIYAAPQHPALGRRQTGVARGLLGRMRRFLIG
jgi:hypothetical protein